MSQPTPPTSDLPKTPSGPAANGSPAGSSSQGKTNEVEFQGEIHFRSDVPPLKRTSKRVLFVGWGRSGKDEAAQFAERHLGLRYGGSTSWAAKELVALLLGVHPMSAWEQRHANRQTWKDYLDVLRENDPTLLIRRALDTGDITSGIRDKVELEAAVNEGLFDRIVWVERTGTPKDPTVTFSGEDVVRLGGTVIENFGTLRDYHRKLVAFFREMDERLRMSCYAIELDGEL